MKIINCKVKVAKKYHEAISVIKYIKDEKIYIVELNDGYKFNWNGTQNVYFNQKDLLFDIRNIVLPKKQSEKQPEPKVKKPRKSRKVKVTIRKKEQEECIIVTSFLTGTKTIEELYKEFSVQVVKDTLKKYDLKSYNYANFKNVRMKTIFGCLRFYKKPELIRLFEILYTLEDSIKIVEVEAKAKTDKKTEKVVNIEKVRNSNALPTYHVGMDAINDVAKVLEMPKRVMMEIKELEEKEKAQKAQ